MLKSYKVLSLFAGAGGFDLGFKDAGFEIIWANEIEESASKTYRQNIGEHVYTGDIKKIKKDDLPKDVDVVIGGFPCQGFSMAGKREVSDERNFLYKEMKRIVKIVKPKIFVAENVRGLISMRNGMVLQKILSDFREIGYNVDYKLLYAPDFEVPQERFRVFIIGTLDDKEIIFPKKISNTYKTVEDAIGDIIELGEIPNHQITQSWPDYYEVIMNKIEEGQKLCNSRHGDSSVYTWDIPEVFGETSSLEKEILITIAKNRRRKKYGKKDGNPLSASVVSSLLNKDESIVKEYIHNLVKKEYLVEKVEGKFDITKASFTRFKRLSWNKPSPTVLTNFDSPRNYIHPSENRPLTVREAARIQTFPDDFVFYGTYKEQYTQVGNAVPPKLAYEVAMSVRKMLGGLSNED